ncbi:Vitamin K-dependent gamma-carboxylase [Algoriella xinjiangensis]|uniref:Vitamin K-dependent gamma-carboxylase n=1 Tax=Algoriella xinjiangensis TaxID=684065 RepID=A0A1I4Z5V0_9FLAO|nr:MULTISPECIES: HTTM domain-containing protein [Algoriella]MBO6212052.1 HTTM domain-containing protein [Algoriella sp.]SFN45645.1 Vitamin K-dependent gamma-carboxylase [Algoriella xinjiangensis]VDH16508.1 Vitamin K-dependent gamma-carboxylase [Algoriella xinjiangensis]
MFSEYLFRKVDNSPLVIFRVIFGLLIVAECWGAIYTGWVQSNFVDPKISFSFIGFEWSNVFLGAKMIYFYIAMGILGWFIAFGFAYRFSTIVFALLWSLTYFMQKTSYNNHYYLFMLVSWMMTVIPAHQFFSVDSLMFPKIKRLTCRNWVPTLFIIQLLIVYTFAAFHKIYPDWFNGVFLQMKFHEYGELLTFKYNLAGLGKVVSSLEFAQVFAWTGFFFDLLIIPAMMFKKTRSLAIKCAIFFHIFNSAVFGIGIFPFFALAMMIFFYDPVKIQEMVFPKKSFMMDRSDEDNLLTTRRVMFSYLLCFYVLWQVYLPVRHLFIPGNVFWTEEGHRLSWRMMLRNKAGEIEVFVAKPDPKNKGKFLKREKIKLDDYLTYKQISKLAISPDMMWQFARFVKHDYAEKGIKDVKVFVDAKVSVNGSEYYQFTNPNYNLGVTTWSYFGHQKWIENQPKELHLSYFE